MADCNFCGEKKRLVGDLKESGMKYTIRRLVQGTFSSFSTARLARFGARCAPRHGSDMRGETCKAWHRTCRTLLPGRAVSVVDVWQFSSHHHVNLGELFGTTATECGRVNHQLHPRTADPMRAHQEHGNDQRITWHQPTNHQPSDKYSAGLTELQETSRSRLPNL